MPFMVQWTDALGLLCSLAGLIVAALLGHARGRLLRKPYASASAAEVRSVAGIAPKAVLLFVAAFGAVAYELLTEVLEDSGAWGFGASTFFAVFLVSQSLTDGTFRALARRRRTAAASDPGGDAR
jgi:hypothetical protein